MQQILSQGHSEQMEGGTRSFKSGASSIWVINQLQKPQQPTLLDEGRKYVLTVDGHHGFMLSTKASPRLVTI